MLSEYWNIVVVVLGYVIQILEYCRRDGVTEITRDYSRLLLWDTVSQLQCRG